MILNKKKPKYSKITRHRAISSTTNATWTDVGMNLCLRINRPENHRLSHGTAHTKYGKFRNRKSKICSQEGTA
jgi:hypothetical protein